MIQKVKVLEAAWKGGELEGLAEKCMPLWAIICNEVKKQKERLGAACARARSEAELRQGGAAPVRDK